MHIELESLTTTSDDNNDNNTQDPPGTDQEESDIGIHSDGEKSLIHRVTLPVVLYMSSCIVIILLLLQHYFQPIDVINVDFWWSMTAFTGIQGVLIPLWFTIWYPNIRLYGRRQVQYYIDGVMEWALGVIRCIKRCSTTVVPASNLEMEIR